MSFKVIAVDLKLSGLGTYEGDLRRAGSATKAFGNDVDGIGTHMSKTKHVFSAFGGSAVEMGHKLESAGKSMTIGITAPLAIIGAKGISTASDFEKSMNTMAAVAGVPGPELEKLRELSIKLGADTVFSANEAAQAQLELGKAGISTADIMGGALANTLDLATAGDFALADAATIAANAMNTFGLSGKDSEQAVDALAGAANASSADVSDLAQALAQGGLAANAAGFSIQETTAYLAAFADKGLKGSDAGTSLKTMLLNLVPVTDKAKAAMKEYGISFTDSNGKMKSAAEIAEILQSKLGHLSDAEQQTALKVMFGTDAYRAALIAMEQGADGINKYIESTSEAGAASEVAAAKMEGLPGVIERIKGSFETGLLKVGEALAPTFTVVADAVGILVNAFVGLPEPVQSVAVHLGLVFAAIGPLLLVTGKLMSLWGSAAGTVQQLVLAYMRLTAGTDAATAAQTRLGVAMKGVAALAALDYVVGGALRSETAFKDASKAAEAHGDAIAKMADSPVEALAQLNSLIDKQEAAIKGVQRTYHGFGALRSLLPWDDNGREAIRKHVAEIEGYERSIKNLDPPARTMHRNSLDNIQALERQNTAMGAMVTGANLGQIAVLSQAKAQDELGAAVRTTNALTDSQVTRQQELAKATGQTTLTVQETTQAHVEQAEKVYAGLQLQEEALGKFAEAVGSSYNSATSLVQKFGAESEVTAAQVMKHFADQVEAAKNWSSNLVSLAHAGIDQGLLRELSEAGPKSAALVKALLDAVAKGDLDAINKAQADLRTILDDTISQINGKAPAAGAAASVGGSFKDSLGAALSQARSDTGNTANYVVTEFRRVDGTRADPKVTVGSNAGTEVPWIKGMIASVTGKTVDINVRAVGVNAAVGAVRGAVSAAGRHSGGPIFHDGGEVPRYHIGGSPRYDERDIRAQVGEWVIQKSSVAAWERQWGSGIMAAINQGPQATPWANARSARSGGSMGSPEQIASLAASISKGGNGGVVIEGDLIVNIKGLIDPTQKDVATKRYIEGFAEALRQRDTAGK